VPAAHTFHHFHLLPGKTSLRVNAAHIVMQSTPQLAPHTLIFYSQDHRQFFSSHVPAIYSLFHHPNKKLLVSQNTATKPAAAF